MEILSNKLLNSIESRRGSDGEDAVTGDGLGGWSPMLFSDHWLITRMWPSTPDTGESLSLNMNFEFESLRTREKDLQAYKEAFDYYDWNKSGIIAVKVKIAED